MIWLDVVLFAEVISQVKTPIEYELNPKHYYTLNKRPNER